MLVDWYWNKKELNVYSIKFFGVKFRRNKQKNFDERILSHTHTHTHIWNYWHIFTLPHPLPPTHAQAQACKYSAKMHIFLDFWMDPIDACVRACVSVRPIEISNPEQQASNQKLKYWDSVWTIGDFLSD